MKSIVLMMMLTSVSMSVIAQVNFRSVTLAETLIDAKKSNKLIFIDCYTSWCAPCKQMNTNVFQNERVGKYLNQIFCNLKFDMEKGEGIEIAKRYKMSGFPTFLILDSSGREIHRIVGAYGVDEFIKLIEDGISNTLHSQNERFVNGENNHDFLIKYMSTLAEAYRIDEIPKVMDRYILQYGNVLKSDQWPLIRKYLNDPFSKSFDWFVTNKESMCLLFDKNEVENKIDKILYSNIYNTINECVTEDKYPNVDKITCISSLVAKSKTKRSEYFNNAIKYLKFHMQGNIEGCIELYDNYFVNCDPDERFAHTLFLNQTVYKHGAKEDIDHVVNVLKRMMSKYNIPASDPMLSNMFKAYERKRIDAPKKMYAKSFLNKRAPDLYFGDWISKRPKIKDKYILIEFWATWCGPCLMSISKLNDIHNKFKDKLVIVGITDESADAVNAMTYVKPQYYISSDPNRVMNRAFGVRALPHAVIIDPTGIVIWEGFPLTPYDELNIETVQRVISKRQ